MTKLKFRPFFLLVFFVGGSLSAAEVTPIYDFRFFGGQHFFDGKASSVGGNIDFMASPAITFNDRWSLIPTYLGGYQGTRNVQELAGGGTLFNDSTHHNLSVKGIRQMGDSWKVKSTLGVHTEFLRETKDEGWGQGLFDYRKFSGGFEGEYNPSKVLGGRLAYDYYMLRFPNYTSLESSQDDTLSRELAGKDVLNSGNHLLTLNFWSPLLSQGRLDVGFYYNSRGFNDQPLVQLSGDLSGSDRKDTVMALKTNFSHPWAFWQKWRFLGDLGFGYAQTDSNQNHYDAKKTKFIKDYYDYSEFSLNAQITTALGEKLWVVTLGTTYKKRKYSDRPIQDTNGNYLSAKTDITEIGTQFGLTYPVAENFKARFIGNVAWSDSNMNYEKVFRYNYKISNYLFGFSYEY